MTQGTRVLIRVDDVASHICQVLPASVPRRFSNTERLQKPVFEAVAVALEVCDGYRQ
jgi:hypothetical protein